MGLVVKFFLLNIPFILEQMGPVCILLAGVITLGILNHSNELIALKAGGIPLRKIVTPIIVAGVIFSGLLLTMSQFVLPETIASTNKIWNEEVKGRVPLGIYRNGRYYYQSKDSFYSFVRPDPSKNEFHLFSYSTWNKKHQSDSLVASRLAIWQNNTCTLYNGQVQTTSGPDTFKTDIFQARNFDFPERPEDFFVPEYRSLELSLTGLFLDAKRQDLLVMSIKHGRFFMDGFSIFCRSSSPAPWLAALAHRILKMGPGSFPCHPGQLRTCLCLLGNMGNSSVTGQRKLPQPPACSRLCPYFY